MHHRTAAGTETWRGVLLGLLLSGAVLAAPALSQEKPAAGVPAPEKDIAATGAPVGSSSAEVRFVNGLLSVRAEQADLAGLLRKVAETIRIAVEISPDVSGHVSVSFTDLSVEDGIKRVLEASGHTNFAAEFKRTGGAEKSATLEKIIIASGKRGLMPVQATVKPRQDLEGLYAYIKKKFGKYEVHVDEETRRLNWIKFSEPGVSRRINRENMEVFVRARFEDLFPFLGLSLEMFPSSKCGEDKQALYCGFQQAVNSVPVEKGGVYLRIEKQERGTSKQDYVSFEDRSYPDIKVPTEPKLTAEEALKIAQEKYRAEFKGKPGYVEDDANQRKPSQLVIYPKGDRDEKASRYDYYLTWKVGLYGARFYIDAVNGKIVSWHSLLEQLSGTLSGRRYGALVGSSSKEDFLTATHEEGLGGLYIWRASDTDHSKLPAIPIVMTSPDEPNKGYCDGIGSGDLPISTRLDSGWFRIYKIDETSADPTAEWKSGTDEPDLTTEPFTDNQDEGHRANIYQQLFRGMKWLFAVELPHNYPPGGLSVWSSATNLGEKVLVLGDTRGNDRIRFISEAGMSSDVILHELAHAAVYTNRGDSIGVGKPQKGVSEGLAEYFAARMNNDPIMESGILYKPHHLDGRDELLEEVDDWYKDGAIDASDFSHYDNGEAIASVLWDLSRSDMPDSTIWNAVLPETDTPQSGMIGYSPESLYLRLRYFGADPSQLWAAFSTHGVNLWGRPGSWESSGNISDPPDPSAVTLDWFPYYVSGGDVADYVVERRIKGATNPDYQCRLSTPGECSPETTLPPVGMSGWDGNTRWIDHPPLAGQEYEYAVYPWVAGTAWGNLAQRSNVAEVTTDDGTPVPTPAMRSEVDRVSGTVTLYWGVDTGVAGWILKRYAVGVDGSTSLEWSQDIGINAY